MIGLVIAGAIIGIGAGVGVAVGTSNAASESAHATIVASENAMRGQIESARLQADAQKHISDNERFNAGEDRAVRIRENARDAQMTERWFSYLDSITDQTDDFAHAQMVSADGRTTRISLDERSTPSPRMDA